MVTLTLHPGCRDSTPESDMSRKTGNGTVAQPINQRLEWTDADRLRHSKFVGLREDKDAREVVKEHAGEA